MVAGHSEGRSMKLCRHCSLPIAAADCADPRVLHPVHVACLAILRAMPRYKATPSTPLGRLTKDLLPRRTR